MAMAQTGLSAVRKNSYNPLSYTLMIFRTLVVVIFPPYFKARAPQNKRIE